LVAVVATVVPASATAVEIVASNPTGAAWTALAVSTTPRLAATRRDAPTFQEFLHFLQGTRHSHAGGVFVGAQGLTDCAEILPFKEAEQDGRAIRFAQFIDGFVEEWRDQGVVRLGVVLQRIHFHSLPFARLPTVIATRESCGHEIGVPMQPAAQSHILRKGPSLAGQVHKDGLRHVFRPVRVTRNQTERRRINEVNETFDQVPEGAVRAVLAVFGKQALRVPHVQSPVKRRQSLKPNKKVLGGRGNSQRANPSSEDSDPGARPLPNIVATWEDFSGAL
jgi:hypothetical protein